MENKSIRKKGTSINTHRQSGMKPLSGVNTPARLRSLSEQIQDKSAPTSDSDPESIEPLINRHGFSFSEDTYRIMLDNANEGIWVLSLDTTILFANAKASEILGYSNDELIGKTPFNFLAVGERRPVLKMMDELYKGKSQVHERQFRHKNGSLIWALVRSSPVFNSQKQHIGNLGMFTDITQQKKAELELKESNEKLQRLLQSVSDGIFVLNLQGNITEVNQRVLDVTGLPREQFVGRNALELVNSGEKSQGLRDWKVLKKEGSLENREYTFLTVGGQKIIIEARAQAMLDGQGKSTGYVIAARNVTEQKRLLNEKEDLIKKQIQSQEEERKHIAHDLHDNTAASLSLLLLEIDNLLENQELLPQPVALGLNKLRQDIDLIQRDVRRFSHNLRPGALDFLGLQSALDSLTEDMREKGKFAVALDVQGVERRLSDDVELTFFRIAQEALNNSRKHSRASQAYIRLKYHPAKVSLMVSDNGQGFDVKKELEAAIKRGSLGLVGMRERARLIGGNLRIKSRKGTGTSVYLSV